MKKSHTSLERRIEPLEQRIAPAILLVTTVNDSGPGSLRQAILDANSTSFPGPDTIMFSILGAAGGVKTITPTSALPAITEAVTIDGYSQPGASVNNLASGDNAVLLIELNGLNAGPGVAGLQLRSDGSEVRGLVINRFSGDAIDVAFGADNNVIAGNFIGTNADGATLPANINGQRGIFVTASDGNQIGGVEPADRNIISGTAGRGIVIDHAFTGGNVILGNYIGVAKDGVTALGNAQDGIRIFGSNATRIGGTLPGEANVIAHNGGDGIRVEVDSAGTANAIRGNSIFANTGLGIDLGGDGVTMNDPLDADTGANGLQNFPVLTSVMTVGGITTISGTLNSTSLSSFFVDFYSNTAADSSGFGEGRTFLGSRTITTSAAGDVIFNFSPAQPLTPGLFVTATASTTGGTFNTSEFSGNLPNSSVFIWDAGAGADTSWFNPLNWNLDSGVPGSGDTAILNISSTINLPSSTSVGTFQQGAGTFTSPTGVTFTVLNSFDWTGGTQSGSGTTTVEVGGTLTVSGAGVKTLSARTLINNGTVNLSGGDVTASNATFINNGVFNATGNAGVPGSGSGGFTNSATGTLNKNGAGTSAFYIFSNAGTVNAAGGTLNFPNGFTQTAGSTVLSGGSITGNFAFNFQGGELRGTGSIGTNATLVNSGAIIRPGGTGVAGTLTIAAAYNHGAGGRVAVEVGGTGAGQFDVLAVTGNASLGGAMDVSFLGGFTPGASDTFRVLTAANRSGNFQFVNGTLVAQYNPTNVTLVVPPAGQFMWDAGAGADTSWFNPVNWSPDGVPGATDTATLQINATTTLPSSTSVGTLIHNIGIFSGDPILTISAGATLTVLTNFTWRGGTEDGPGTTTVAPGASFNLVSGAQPISLSQRTLNLNGTAVSADPSQAPLTLSNGAVINNSGVLDFQGSLNISGTGTINNLAGGILKHSTTNTALIVGNNVAFTNAGTVRAETGVLGFNGGYTQTAGSSQMFGGALQVQGTLQLQGGEFAGVGAFSGGINNTGGVIRPGGVGTIGTLTTSGTFRQVAGGTVETEIAGTGAGQFDVFAPGGTAILGGTLTAPLLGGFMPAAGNQFAVVTGGIVGTFANTPAGLTAQYSGSSVTLLGPTALTYIWDGGAGADQSWFNPVNWNLDSGVPGAADTAILNINSTINLPASTSVGTFQQSNGTFTSPTGVTFTVLNSFDWSGGTMAGAGTAQTLLPSGSNSTISGAALKTISGRGLTVGGTLVWSGTGNIAHNSGVFSVQSTGLFDLQSDASLGDTDGNVSPATLVIAGTLRKTGGTGTSALGGNLGIGGAQITTTVSASGHVEAQSGTLQFDGGVNSAGIVNALTNTIVFAGGQGTSSGTFHADAGGIVRVSGGVQTLTAGAAITGAGLFDIANGRVDINNGAAVSATNVALNGTSGLLGISGALTVTQSFDWTAGTIGGGASLILAAGSVSTMSGTAFKMFSSGTISLAGTLTWTGTGSLLGTGSGQLIVAQGGLFDLQSDAAFATGSFGGFNTSLIIDGTLRKSAGTGVTRIDGFPSTVSTLVNSTGRVEVQSGTLVFGDNFANNGTVSVLAGTLEINAAPDVDTGTYNAATGTRVLFSSGARTLDPGAALTGPGLFEITGSGFVLNTDITVQNLALHGTFGSISGAANLTINNSLDWTAGTMTGTGKTTLAAASVSTMSGTTDKGVTRDLDLFGTLNINNSSSGVFGINSGTLHIGTGGLMDVRFVSIVDNDSGTPGNLVIDGTLRKSGINDSASIGGRTTGTGSVNITINSGGRLEVVAGPLDFRGNGTNTSIGVIDVTAAGNTALTFNAPFTLNAGASITGAGISAIANNATLTVAAPVNASGTLRLANGTLALAAPLAHSGKLEWNTGTISGASTASFGAITFATAGAKTLDMTAITLTGAGVWDNAGTLTLAHGAGFSIQPGGVLDFQSDATISAGAAPPPAMSNAGILKMTSSGTTAAIGVPFVNSGTVSAEAGTLQFTNAFTQNGGATNLAGGNLSGSLFAFGAGVLSGTGTITGNVDNTGTTVRPGGVGAAGTLTITGNYTQGSGGTLAAEIGGSAAGQFDVLAVSSTATLGGTLTPSLINGFTPASGATFRILTAAPRSGTFGSVSGQFTPQYNASNVTLVAQASTVFTWDAGAGADTSWFNPLNWSPDGVPGATDTAILNTSKTIDLSTADATVTNFQQVTGTLTGTKTLTVVSSFTWSGGTESGTGATTLPSGNTSALSGVLSLSGRTINNSGTVSLTGTGNVSASNGPSFHNLAGGIVDLQSDAGFVYGGPGANLVFDNVGTLRKTGGTGTSLFVPITNTGTILAQSGTLSFAQFTQTAGSTVLGGGNLAGSGFVTFDFLGGELSGAGTITAQVNNSAATVKPGGTGAAGTIAISGGYTQGVNGTLLIEVGGTAAGQFDRLTVGTSAQFGGGPLNSSLIGGFAPAPGTQIQVVTANSVSGTVVASGNFTAQLNSNNVTLTAVASPIYHWDAGAGADTSWFNPLNWAPDGVPGANDTAILDINSTITLPSSTSVGTFIHLNTTFVGSNATLTIPTGSALTILNDFQWNQGGTENGAGTMVIAPGATMHMGTSGIMSTLSQRTLDIQGTAIFPNGGFGNISMANGAVINNSGVMDFQGQFFFRGTGTINNLAGGLLKNTTSIHTVIVDGTGGNTGVAFTNAGTVRAEIGTLGFNGGYVQTAGTSEMVGGDLNIGGAFIATGFQLQGGVLLGTGQFKGNINNTGGIIRPGGAGVIGTLTTNGGYAQTAGGTLETEIAGTAAGQFDVFTPGGSVQVNGTLTAPLLGGFTPVAGDQFPVIGKSISGTFATTPAGFTMQYSSGTLIAAGAASPLVVTTASDVVNANDGVTSLREAITAANTTAGTDTITFNIPGGGVQTITVSSALPALTEAVTIDGYTQPGSSTNTLATGNNAVLNIVLRGASNTLGNGLTLSASGVTVRGLVIQNFTDGIAVNGANAVIAGNWIGVSAAGTAAAGNADDGIQVGASNVTIGGTTPAARNLISGNSGGGIEMTGGFSGLNVQGNYIGTNAAGSAVLGNAGDGIQLQQGATNNTIGGTTAAARNVISGNSSRGVLILGDGNIVEGNYIGTNAAGTAAVKNGFDGLTIAAPGSNNVIGGTESGARNVISGNDIAGVTIESFTVNPAVPASGNRVQGNFIGVAADGVTALGNTPGSQRGWGVAFFRGATNNLIGGTAEGEANKIAFNAGAGVAVLGAGPLGNRISGNAIFSNNELGIDLGLVVDPPNTVLPNDAGDADSGGNGLLNYPVLTSVSLSSTTDIAGTYNGAPNATFTIEFFASNAGDPSGFGEGQTYLGSATISTDATGSAGFTFNAIPLPSGTALSATASDALGNTSEFSAFSTLISASTVVTTTLDVIDAADGVTSLREAIAFANSNPGLDTIGFNIPSAGVQTIAIASPLPAITDAVVIDGYSQPGASANTLATGDDAVLLIRLDGHLLASGADGLEITAGGSTVRGLSIVNFENNGIVLTGSGGNQISGNFIGLEPDGTTAAGNGSNALNIFGAGSNLIGGLTPAQRNIISGNGNGVLIRSSSGNVIQGNYIGTNAAGSASVFNDGDGLTIFSASADTLIGGTMPGARNVISGNDNDAIFLDGVGSDRTIIQGNYLGLDSTGHFAIPNDNDAIFVSTGAAQTRIGGTVPGAGNVISGNNGHGVSFNMFIGQFPTDSDVQGNFIGTDATGTIAIGNLGSGISIFGSNNIRIGGTTPGAGNVIAGNRGNGVEVSRVEAFSNLVAGNFIGVDATGTIALGNGDSGIIIEDAPNNIVGSPGFPNIIGGNGDAGILLMGLGSTNNLVQSNYIGATPPGSSSSVAIPNAGAGVAVRNGASGNFIGSSTSGNIIAGNTGDGVLIDHADNNVVSGNRIGQVDVATGFFGNGGAGVNVNDSLGIRIGNSLSELNVISHNVGAGVRVTDTSTVTARLNIMEDNGRLGIDLVGGTENASGVTANDSGDADTGPNSLLNFPTLTSAILVSGSTYTISGVYDGAANSDFTIDLYANEAADASGFGEALFPLSSFTVTTDGSGHASFSQDVTLPSSGPFGGRTNAIFASSATTGDGTTGPTSEFSQAVHADVAALTARISNAAVVEGQRNTNLAVFTVRLSEPATGPVSIHYATHDLIRHDAAIAGEDYDFQEGDVSFGIGERTKEIMVVVRGDRTPETREWFGLTLSNVSGAGLENSEASGAILDDDHHLLFTAQGLGSQVEIRNATSGDLVRGFFAFAPGFTGGVRVASGDVNGDGFNDVITGAGNGGGARVRVYDGHNVEHGRPVKLYDFVAFGDGYRGGVYVAAGDVNGDGHADIIVAPSAGSSAEVRIFDGENGTALTSFFAFGRGAGGVRVATGDVNGDGFADIIAGTGKGSSVRIFDGQDPSVMLDSFRAFPRVYDRGISVAGGDVNGDGLDDVIVGAAKASNLVRIFLAGQEGRAAEFAAYGGPLHGVQVGAVDINSDGIADIITAQGRGGDSKVRIYKGNSVLNDAPKAPIKFNAFGPEYSGGVFVG